MLLAVRWSVEEGLVDGNADHADKQQDSHNGANDDTGNRPAIDSVVFWLLRSLQSGDLQNSSLDRSGLARSLLGNLHWGDIYGARVDQVVRPHLDVHTEGDAVNDALHIQLVWLAHRVNVHQRVQVVVISAQDLPVLGRGVQIGLNGTVADARREHARQNEVVRDAQHIRQWIDVVLRTGLWRIVRTEQLAH